MCLIVFIPDHCLSIYFVGRKIVLFVNNFSMVKSKEKHSKGFNVSNIAR